MKKLICLLLFVWQVGVSQDVDATVALGVNFYRNTLTATLDTVDVTFTSPASQGIGYYTVVAYSTGDDTAQVWILSNDGLTWTQQGMVDLSDNSNDTQIIATTTSKEFVLYDVTPRKIRLITTDHSAALTFILGGKRVFRAPFKAN